MKNYLIFKIAIVFLFTVQFVTAQVTINKPIEIKDKGIKTKTKLLDAVRDRINATLDLAIIKQNIENFKACYQMQGAVSYTQKNNDNPLSPPKQGYTTTANYLKSESNYLRMNSLLLLSEKSFSRAAGNNFEIILSPRGAQINPDNVKVTWRFSDIGVKTFLLENVQIVYSQNGITLTGHKTIEGKQLAFSFAISEVTCLI